MKIVTLKSVLWLCVIFLMVLSYPIQVMLSSPMPALFPYVGIGLILLLTWLSPSWRRRSLIRRNRAKYMNLLLGIYLLLVFFQTGWQILFGFISPVEGITVIFIYVFPMIFFIYFKQYATEIEIRNVLIAMALIGLVVGLYFAYDNYMKLVFGQVSDYAQKAMDYSLSRKEDPNKGRISVWNRGFGLLEMHTVSSAWISFGCFAALSFIPQTKIWQRTIIIATYGLLLLIGLNFTGLIGFIFVIFLFEFRAMTWFHGRIYMRSFKTLGLVASVLILLGFLVFYATGWEMLDAISKILTGQIGLAKGIRTTDELPYFVGLINDLAAYPINMSKFPPGFLIGDGFSLQFYVYQKGGDYGIVDTLHRFGLPFFLSIIFGLISIIRQSFRQVSIVGANDKMSTRYLWFAMCIIVYLLFTEIHYTVWNAKSILPIFFLALALYARSHTTHLRKIYLPVASKI